MWEPAFDYQREFFRRPLWDPGDRLFVQILLIVALLTVSHTLLAVHYFGNRPLHREVVETIKTTYLARILDLYRDKTPPRDVEKPPPILPQPLTEEELTRRAVRNVTEMLEKVRPEPIDRKKLEQIAPVKEKPRIRNIQPLMSAAESSRRMREAVERITVPVDPMPPVTYTPLQPLQEKKKLYEENIRKLASALESEGQKIEESFTDFEIVRGYRDPEQMIAVIRSNDHRIKACVTRYLRNLPSAHGMVVVKFVVHPEGYVKPGSVRIVESSIPDPRVVDCIKKTISRWRNFPQVAYEYGEYTMTQKYIF